MGNVRPTVELPGAPARDAVPPAVTDVTARWTFETGQSRPDGAGAHIRTGVLYPSGRSASQAPELAGRLESWGTQAWGWDWLVGSSAPAGGKLYR